MSERARRWYLPRIIHPVAWWVWALGIAAAASSTTNVLILVMLIAATVFVVLARRGDTPWARSFTMYVVLAAVIVAMRVGFRILFGGAGDVVLVHLPRIDLPAWTNGMHLLGDITVESVLSGLADGLRLGTILLAVGAANSLAHPRRLLRSFPAALHELGTILIVAVSVLPQLAESFVRVRRAQALRGDRSRLGSIAAVGIPVLTDSLDRSLVLASSMDSRGYGRFGPTPPRARRLAGTLTIVGLIAICAGVYGVLDPSGLGSLGRDVLLLGIALGLLGMWVSSRHLQVTRYRPDRWDGPALVLVACGLLTGVPFVLATIGYLDLGFTTLDLTGLIDPVVLAPSLSPPEWPQLGPTAVLACVAALLPAFLVPAAPLASTATGVTR